ncbi:hypothetical protein H1215_12380, partial [Anoxybacillus sp. LAT_38]
DRDIKRVNDSFANQGGTAGASESSRPFRPCAGGGRFSYYRYLFTMGVRHNGLQSSRDRKKVAGILGEEQNV